MTRTRPRPVDPRLLLCIAAALVWAVAVALMVGCSDTRTTGGGVSILQPTIPSSPVAAFQPYSPSQWPAPFDGFGGESPSAAPNECDCPASFSPSYNGHNWICRRGTDAYFPVKNAFCNIER